MWLTVVMVGVAVAPVGWTNREQVQGHQQAWVAVCALAAQHRLLAMAAVVTVVMAMSVVQPRPLLTLWAQVRFHIQCQRKHLQIVEPQLWLAHYQWLSLQQLVVMLAQQLALEWQLPSEWTTAMLAHRQQLMMRRLWQVLALQLRLMLMQ